MGANIGWLFYKDYFKGINYNNLEDKKNELIIKDKVENIIIQTPNIEESKELGNIHFKATTTYPGLILGSGNAHELPSIEGQAILGFHFDYTSGLPVISGSSIKGVLRSAFPLDEAELETKLKHLNDEAKEQSNDKDKEQLILLNNAKYEYIKEYSKLESFEDVIKLKKQIFDNSDIFFDAEIIKADGFGKILGDDFLAPHGDNPLKNPIPLRFIKVLPNVTFRFDFELSDGIIKKQTKSKLFQDILEDLGLGAKTNVGYGKFESFSLFKTEAEEIQEEKERELQKKLEAQKREEEQKKLQEQKAAKAEGITLLNSCKDIKSAMKIINDSLGKKGKPTPEQKEIIEKFWKKFEKRASKSEIKFFKKFI